MEWGVKSNGTLFHHRLFQTWALHADALVRLKNAFGFSPFTYSSGVKQVRFSQTIPAVNLPIRLVRPRNRIVKVGKVPNSRFPCLNSYQHRLMVPYHARHTSERLYVT